MTFAQDKELRGTPDALLLRGSHRCGCAAEPSCRALPHLDDDQQVATAADEIEFAGTAAEIPHHDFNPVSPDKVRGKVLGRTTAALC